MKSFDSDSGHFINPQKGNLFAAYPHSPEFRWQNIERTVNNVFVFLFYNLIFQSE